MKNNENQLDRIENSGALYVVATPIGHLGDISYRAVQILKQVDRIAAEDTRHTKRLLSHFGISTPLTSLHGHNEESKAKVLLRRLDSGERLALVSDAGTPLISDPGSILISMVADAQYPVIPVPGACAAIAALSTSGLNTEQFVFEGFLPARSSRRKKRLAELSCEPRTLLFYEAVHRVLSFFNECRQAFGGDRRLVVARELTKQYESVIRGTVSEIIQHYEAHQDQIRGEFVIVIEGNKEGVAQQASLDPRTVLSVLLTDCSVSKAAVLAAKLLGGKKSDFYSLALSLSQDD